MGEVSCFSFSYIELTTQTFVLTLYCFNFYIYIYITLHLHAWAIIHISIPTGRDCLTCTASRRQLMKSRILHHLSFTCDVLSCNGIHDLVS